MNPSAVLFGGGKRVSVRCPETRRERQRDRETERQRDRERARERERKQESNRSNETHECIPSRLKGGKTKKKNSQTLQYWYLTTAVLVHGAVAGYFIGLILDTSTSGGLNTPIQQPLR